MQHAIQDWLVLQHASTKTSFNLFPLLQLFNSATHFLEQLRQDQELQQSLPDTLLRSLKQPDMADIDSDLRWLDAPDNHYIHCHSSNYPDLLSHIPCPPVGLYIQGRHDVVQTDQLAIVGSRKPTKYGRDNAQRFSQSLARKNLVITSGLASGIDSTAHKAALSAGVTIAVLGHGFNYMYPAKNKSLAEDIGSNGALITEYPASYPPYPGNFPRRNRIISGLCLGTLVIEAASRSGSLITARHSMEQGREVFAIPGSINNVMAAGCHALIQNGAKLVNAESDILAELMPQLGMEYKPAKTDQVSHSQKNKLDEIEKVLLDNIGYDPISLDELYLITNISIDKLTSKLLNLELKNLVSVLSPGIYIRN